MFLGFLTQCAILNEKLDALLKTLNEESQASTVPPASPPQEPVESAEEDNDVFDEPSDEVDTVPEHMTGPPNTKSVRFLLTPLSQFVLWLFSCSRNCRAIQNCIDTHSVPNIFCTKFQFAVQNSAMAFSVTGNAYSICLFLFICRQYSNPVTL